MNTYRSPWPSRFLALISTVLLLSINAYAQKEDGNVKFKPLIVNENKSITISGNIKRMTAKEGSLVDHYAFQYEDLVTGEKITIPINRDTAGNFTVTFTGNGLQELVLTQALQLNDRLYFGGYTQFRFFAKPGDNLRIDFQPEHGKRKLEFRGTGSLLNAQHRDYQKKLDASEFSTLFDYEILDSLKPEGYPAFKAAVSERLKAALEYNRQYFSVVKTEPMLRKMADYDVIYSSAHYLIQAVLRHKIKDHGLPEFFKANQIMVNNPDAYGSDAYISFIDQYHHVIEADLPQERTLTVSIVDMAKFLLASRNDLTEEEKAQATKLADKNYKATDEEARNFMNGIGLKNVGAFDAASPHNLPEFDQAIEIKDPFLRDLYATKVLYKQLSTNNIAYIAPNLEIYKKTVRPSKLKDTFLKRYQQEYNAHYYAKLSEKSILHDKDALDSNDPLQSILNKYKGKVVYVDIWATWCGPCMAEMPESAKLRSKPDTQGAVFIYICVNSPSTDAWKKLVAAKQIEGENYFLSYEESNNVTGRLGIKSIPHHLLVDANGNIVQAKAEGPGSKATLAAIKELLAK